MLSKKPVGPQAAAVKYDVLTALGTYALSQSKGKQVLCLRLMTLITARYNWQRNELAVGQREIARMWGVEERTVKREMAKLRAMEWLVVKRQGARGRVTEYALSVEKLLKDTRPIWAAVGPDFEQRLEGQGAKPADTDAKVVPLQRQGRAVSAPEVDSSTEWGLARSLIYAEDPARFSSWIAALERGERVGRRLYLNAPSRFHAHYVATHLNTLCLGAVQQVDPDIDEVIVVSS
ncbi:hypothetical protein [Celeribacter litoreus]|uniref:hypothetical protein n=1 Tax=Celeribacter litoreus TaxID=2876714 RepID=UPI001CCD89D0|nr:hypothetical protein [Celeribacter litoreus]MCA0043350.1 hypothetical protein [Celeribacter litoreus]